MTQDRLFDAGDMPAMSPASPVLAFDLSRTTNGQRVLDLAALGYLPEPVLDPTLGKDASMWTHHRPDQLVGTDIDPIRALDAIADFCALPFRDNSFASSLFDPPYKMGGDVTYVRTTPVGASRHDDLSDRFAVNTGRRVNVRRLYRDGLAECCRVTTRFVIVKVQDQVHGTGIQFQTGWVLDDAAKLGWRLRDLLHLRNNIVQPTDVQHHVRRNYSSFVVLCPKPNRRRR